MRMKKLALLFLLIGCTEPRVKRYATILDPLLGSANKKEVSKALKVSPVSCKPESGGEQCEYRTAAGRNEPLPITHRQSSFGGPDLSPLDYYDVIFVSYDGLGVFKDWRAAPTP